MASGFPYPYPVCRACQQAEAVSSPGVFMARISNLNLENILLKGLFNSQRVEEQSIEQARQGKMSCPSWV